MTWFPLEDGCVLYSCHINTIHGNIVGMRVTEAETAMNITKLQYCQSVTDINHDYMVVDVMTDSTGYNNTVNATYCCYSGTVTGHNVSCTVTSFCCAGAVGPPCHCYTVGNYCAITCVFIPNEFAQYACSTELNTLTCNCAETIDISGKCAFCYCLVCRRQVELSGDATCYGGTTTLTCLVITGSPDDSSSCCCSLNCVYNTITTNCYCFTCKGLNCWKMYCNSMYKCDICLATFPTINFCQIAYTCRGTGTTNVNAITTVTTYISNPCSFCNPGSTSTYCSSGLTGYYLNGSTLSTTIYHCQLECSGSASLGDYFTIAQGHYTCICNSNGSARACVCNQFCLDDISCISFCLQIQLQKQYSGGGGSSCGIISNWHDDWSAGHTSSAIETCTYTRCYAYSLISAGCYCFYCNGSGKCEVTMNTFPNIVFCSIGNKEGSTDVIMRTATVCMVNFSNTCSNDTLISTVPIEYTAPAKTSYLTLEKVGTGTITYNVYDATTDTLIGENLLPNTLNTLDCCVQCHRYEIIQCSDGVSCIKSYAIVTGVY